MFSTNLLRYSVNGKALEPSYLDDRHGDVVRKLIEHYAAFEGRPYGEVEKAVRELSDLAVYESRLVSGLRRVIEESVELKVEAAVDPPKIRATLFPMGNRERDLLPKDAYEEAARSLGVSAEQLSMCLYADLKRERRVRFAADLPPVAEIISRYNLRLLQGFFLHAEKISVQLFGNVRAVYRLAKLNGLLVEVNRNNTEGHIELEVTGPLSLFKKTRKYGYALARFLPACCAAGRYRLVAWVVLRQTRLELVASAADRILSSHRLPRAFDSKLEERFHRDFLRMGSRWEISREAQLVKVGSTAFIPDFTFRLRTDPIVRVDLEIVGFWTRDYLARKFTLMKNPQLSRVIFCVDSKLCCDRETATLPCLFFKGRVPANEVLERLEKMARFAIDP